MNLTVLCCVALETEAKGKMDTVLFMLLYIF